MGRKYNPIPIPIQYRRQYILSLSYITEYTKSMLNRNFVDRIEKSLQNIFQAPRNVVTKNVSDSVRQLTESRFFTHFR